MKKIVTIVGARPQFIKAAPLSRALRNSDNFSEILVHTGQHYDANMSDVFFADLEIKKPEYNLGVGSASHAKQTAEILIKLEDLLLQEKPAAVIIFGDTNSTLAGALAAVKLHIPIVHVEAGLRSFNRNMPEEINRLVADQLADILFAPTDTAVGNLQQEGFAADRIFQVGDIMYDVALYYGQKAEQQSTILQQLQLLPRQYVLATIHREENTDDPQRLTAILQGLNQVGQDMPVILPMHPRTRKMLDIHGISTTLTQNTQVVGPLGFLDMMLLEKNARVIATDSGGVQKEAFFYQVPCVTLRTETEWTELVTLGWNKVIAPANAEAVTTAIFKAINSLPNICQTQPYGNGNTAQEILSVLGQHY